MGYYNVSPVLSYDHDQPSGFLLRNGRGNQGLGAVRLFGLLDRPTFRILANLVTVKSCDHAGQNERTFLDPSKLQTGQGMQSLRTSHRTRKDAPPDDSTTNGRVVSTHARTRTLMKPTFIPNNPASKAPVPIPSVAIDTYIY